MDLFDRLKHRPDKRHIYHGADLGSAKVMTAKEYLSQIMEYDRQVSEIVKKNRDGLKTVKDQPSTAGEYMYQFKKTDRLRPVSTLVLYWNSEPWDGAKTLHELVDFTGCEEMMEIAADYKLNIVNLDTVQNGDEIFQNRDVKDVVNLYQKRNDKTAFKEYVDNQKNFDRESIEVITEMVTSKELKEYMLSNKDNKGGNLDMCKAINDLIQDGKIEVYADLIKDGDMTVEKAASKMQITVEEFIEQAEALGFKLASN